METISSREFQRNFKYYKGVPVKVTFEGRTIGSWVPNGLVRQDFKVASADYDETPMVSIANCSQDKRWLCEKCHEEKFEVYQFWEDGEERKVCIDCIKKAVPAKMLKSTLRKMAKCI